MEQANNSLLTRIGNAALQSRNKITIVGAGQVGLACAISCLNQNIANDLVLIDVNEDKVKGEVLDLQQGTAFMPNVRVYGGSDYSLTTNSKICIIAAGARQTVGESRLDLLNKNYAIFSKMIPEIVKYSPDIIILVVTNPVDILTYVTWKISGLPVHRVIGSGTNLDTARFKELLSSKFGTNMDSVGMWVLGEHGDASVPIWSSLSVSGSRLVEGDIEMHKEKEMWKDMHKSVINSAYEIIKLKGYTAWAIGLSCSDICKSIFHNTSKVHPISTLAKNFYGIEEEVFLSLPCLVGQNGISHVVNINMTESERKALQSAAKKIYNFQIPLKVQTK